MAVAVAVCTLVVTAMVVATPAAAFVAPVISTIAGTGVAGSSGDTGPASAATLSSPGGVAVDLAGNIYIVDTGNHRVRVIDAATGTIDRFAGTGASGLSGDGGLARDAKLWSPVGVVADAAGNVFIADRYNGRIRRVDATTKVITTVAGSGPAGGGGGIGVDGVVATSSLLSWPRSVAVDGAGNLYIADSASDRIRRVDAATQVITTVAGTGVCGFSGDGGQATAAKLCGPFHVAFDPTGSLVIADTNNDRVRRVDLGTGVITTIAGGGTSTSDGVLATTARFSMPTGVDVDGSGGVLVVDLPSQKVRRIDPATGLIRTVAGTGFIGNSGDGGAAILATLRNPTTVAAIAPDEFLIADTHNHAVRRVAVQAGVPDVLVDTTVDSIDVAPGDGACADAAGRCSLRAAVMESNAELGAETIWLPMGTYVLTLAGAGEDAGLTGDLDVTDELAIRRIGSSTSTFIDAAGIDRVVHATAPLTLEIDVRNGVAVPDEVGDVIGGNVLATAGLTMCASSSSGGLAAGTGLRAGSATAVLGGDVDLCGVSLASPGAGSAGTGAIYIDTPSDRSIVIGTPTTGATVASTAGTGIRIHRSAGAGLAQDIVLWAPQIMQNGGDGVVITSDDDRGTVVLGAEPTALASSIPQIWGNAGRGLVSDLPIAVERGRIADNLGGGIVLLGGASTIEAVRIEGNAATNGGGLRVNGAQVVVTDSVIEGNHATSTGGGVMVEGGVATLERTSVLGNTADASGGGARAGVFGTLVADTSTFSGNAAPQGGAVSARSASQTRLRSTTISESSTSAVGGGALAWAATASMRLEGSLIAAQQVGADCAAGAAPTSVGGNVDGDGSCVLGAGDTSAAGDPSLGPISDGESSTVPVGVSVAGRATPVHVPARTSPVIDAGPATCDSPDQRGKPRPLDAACDAGSVEVAASLVVDSADDTQDVAPGDGTCADGVGECSLRAAVIEANALAGSDAIDLPAGTFELTIPGNTDNAALTGDLDVTGPLTITGAGPAATIVDGGGLDRILHAEAPLTVEEVQLRNGVGDGFGGAIIAENDLQMRRVRVTDSEVTGSVGNAFGSAIVAGANTVLEDIEVDGNGNASLPTEMVWLGTCEAGEGHEVRIELDRVRIHDNEGTGLEFNGVEPDWKTTNYSCASSLIRDSSIEANTRVGIRAGGYPGGPVVRIERSTISSNGDSGASLWRGGFTIVDSTLSGNGSSTTIGGAIRVEEGPYSRLRVERSTISGNEAARGGAIFLEYANQTPVILESTITGNSTIDGTSAAFVFGRKPYVHTTVVGDQVLGADCLYVVTSGGGNADTDGTCGLDDASDLGVVADGRLGPLADNGGLTLTHRPYGDSPLLDAGGACTGTDQRGIARPQGPACDIGAVEVVAGELPPAVVSGTVLEDGAASPLGGISVRLLTTGNVLEAVTTTAADGSYAFDPAPPGVHKVRFIDLDGSHVGEWFDDATTPAAATPVIAADGAVAVADAALAVPGGKVRGQVTQQGAGGNLAGISVRLLTTANALVGTRTTGADGRYEFAQVPVGDYLVRFIDLDGSHVSEYHLDAATWTAATPVPVVVTVTSTVNAALASATAGDVIGTVTEDGTATPLAGVSVRLQTTSGALVATRTSQADGTFAFYDVAPGDYLVRFIDLDDSHDDEWHLDATSLATATTVTVGSAAATTVDAALAPASTTFVVDATADTIDATPGDHTCADAAGDCTLRAAIMEANATIGIDVVEVPAGSYLLTLAGSGEDASATGDLDVIESLVVQGASAATTTIDGAALDNVIESHVGATLEVHDVTITGSAPSVGAALRARDALLVEDALLVDNPGQAIEATGPGLVMRRTTVSGTAYDVAVAVTSESLQPTFAPEPVLLEDVQILDSAYTAFQMWGPADFEGFGFGDLVHVRRSTFAGGTNAFDLLGMYGARIEDVSISDFHLADTVNGNEGAAIGAGSVDVTLLRSTISGNTAVHGSIINMFPLSEPGPFVFFPGDLTVENSTISDNAGEWGVVRGDEGVHRITRSTITGSSATGTNTGALALSNADSVTIEGSFIGDNVAGPNCSIYTVVTSLGGNADTDGTCGFTHAADVGTVASGLLGALADNGGLTWTHLLLAGSPLLDAAGACTGTDQRGVPRPQGAACDVGSVEVVPAGP